MMATKWVKKWLWFGVLGALASGCAVEPNERHADHRMVSSVSSTSTAVVLESAAVSREAEAPTGPCLDPHAVATVGPSGTLCVCPDGRSGSLDLICVESLIPSGEPGPSTVEPSELPVPPAEEEEPYPYDPQVSTPNVPVTCVEAGRAKLVSGTVALCDQNGDITCNSAASCLHLYKDPPKCFQAGCSGNNFIANVTSSNTLINGATLGWPVFARVSACATLIAAANIAVIAKCDFSYPPCDASPWPAPTPGGVCKWADP